MIFDAIIAGGGVVGLVTAALLHDGGYRVCVLEPQLSSTPPSGDIGLRTYALTPAARRILEAAGAWPALAHDRLGRFFRMDVWDAGSKGRLQFAAPASHRGALGYLVEHQNLIAALVASLATRPAVSVHAQALSGFAAGSPLDVTLTDGRRLRTRLLIGADGAQSQVRMAAGIALTQRSYRQSAIVCNAVFACPHGDVARQRFLATGPVAALPLADPYACGIVWSCNDERAAELLASDDAEFSVALCRGIEDRLGAVRQISARAVFPLARAHAARMVDGACVLLGDAAHVLHPLAGQGLNMGLMDAAALVECLGPAGTAPWPSATALRRFERWRKSETLAMTLMTDGLHRLFQHDETLARQVRGLGMQLTQRIAPLKHWLISRAMGTAGDVPRLAMPHAGP